TTINHAANAICQVPAVETACALALVPQQPPAFALPGALLLGLAFVVKLLPARQRDFNLGLALFIEIKFEGNKRHSLALDSAGEPVDLATVQQQFARTLGCMVEAPALQIFCDIGI